MQVSLVTMSHPSQRTVAPPPCLPLYIKDSLKENRDSFMEVSWEFLIDGLLLLSYARD
jgi:hypothetical protein